MVPRNGRIYWRALAEDDEMTIDRYTKWILTVIAVSLVYLCVLRTIEPITAHAQQSYSVPTQKDNNGTVAVPVVVFGANKDSGLWVFTPKR
jgi:hypothetical protein